MRGAAGAVADARRALRREVLRLVILVLLLDAGFIAGYALTGMAAAPGSRRGAYTVLWTVATLVVVLWCLGRIRTLRVRLRVEQRR